MKFNVLTVPHSGSRFLMRFFSYCNMYHFNRFHPDGKEDYLFNHFWHNGSQNADKLNSSYSYEKTLPIVCTLRHPYSVAISWMTRGKHIGDMISCYRQFIIFAENHHVHLFDVECPQEHRESALRNVLEYCDVYDASYEDDIKLYAKEWEPIGSRHSDIRKEYQLHNKLPSFNWTRFDGLVNWHNTKIQQFNYDNISS